LPMKQASHLHPILPNALKSTSTKARLNLLKG